MSPQLLQQIQFLQAKVPLLAAGLFGFAILLMLIAVYFFRKSRTDFYWRRRRTAGQRGWRIFVASVFVMLLSGVACLVTGVAGIVASSQIVKTPTVIATAVVNLPTETPTVVDKVPINSSTQAPTLTMTTKSSTATQTNTEDSVTSTGNPTTKATASGRAPTQVFILKSPTPKGTSKITPTVTVSPSPTPLPTRLAPTTTLSPTNTKVVSAAVNALESSVTPGVDAVLKITALDIQLSAESGPVTPATSFKAGFKRLYYFVTFSKMQTGVLWRRQLFQDDQVIEDADYLWGLAQDGNAYFFFGQESGFKAGQYKILLFLGENTIPIAQIQFSVTP